MNNMLNYLAVPCLLTDDNFQITDANDTAREVFGRYIEPDRFSASTKAITRLVTSDLPEFFRWVQLANDQKKSAVLAIQCAHKIKKFLVSHSQHSVDGKVTFFFTFASIERKMGGDSHADLYRQTFERSNQSIYLTDADNNVLFINPSFTQFFGRSSAEMKGRKDNILYHQNAKDMHDEAIDRLIHDVDQIEERMSCVTAFNADKPVVCSVNIVLIHDGESHKFLHFIEDITDQVSAEESMKVVAFQDPLTGIANRHSFNVKFNDLYGEAQRQGHQLNLFFIDLDKFKFINDQYGHEYGDVLLIHVAKCLQKSSKASDFIARLGGDEFVILIQNDHTKSELESIARRILSELSRPFILKDLDYICTCSIGIAQYPDDAISQTDLLNAADSAMYIAKHSGRNDFSFYNYEKQKQTTFSEQRFQEIELAVKNDLIQLYYQPIHNMVTGEVTSFEALSRYHDEQGELHLPEYFLPYIESDPLIYKLGVSQIKEITRYLKILKHHGIQLPISINLSSYQIKSDKIINQLKAVANDSPDIVRLLKIEVTEIMLFEDDSITVKNLSYLDKLGFSLVLDDFGTGHSSIYSLKKIDFETVKIDQIFIDEIKSPNGDDKKFLNAIIAMIKNLNTKIICEGVETKQQVDYLLQRGCNTGQGFYYSKAMPKNEILTYLGV